MDTWTDKKISNKKRPSGAVVSWLSLLHNFIQLSLNSGFAQVQTYLQHVGDLRWWESLTLVLAGNKAKRLSSVNHTTKTIQSSKSEKSQHIHMKQITLPSTTLDFIWLVIDSFIEENGLAPPPSPKKEILSPNTGGPQEIWNFPSL